MNGFAVIFLGFVAFGVLHTKVGFTILLDPPSLKLNNLQTPNFMPWQWSGYTWAILLALIRRLQANDYYWSNYACDVHFVLVGLSRWLAVLPLNFPQVLLPRFSDDGPFLNRGGADPCCRTHQGQSGGYRK